MARATYASVEPLLTRTEVAGEVIRCTFTCPATGACCEAEGPLVKGRELADISTAEDSSLLTSIRSVLGSLLRGALGSSEPTPAGEGDAEDWTEGERQAGVLLAFRSVASRWVWDAHAGRWISSEGASELLPEFARQLEVAPIVAAGDREIASRMLVELARTDGQVTPPEWQFLSDFIPGDISSVDTCMEKPALTREELATASGGAVRDTMLMLAWALAYTDDAVDEDETRQLLSWADGLGIPEGRALELRGYAREYLIDEAFLSAYRAEALDAERHAEALRMGARLGLDEEEVAAAEERIKRRLGRT